ncbi:MAG TPA: hypothetical protein VGF31_11665, partial [Myxococcaceae bacterium]
MLDLALAGDQHPHLPADLPSDLGEVAGQLGADDLPGTQAAAVGVAKALGLGGLEAQGVSGDVLNGLWLLGDVPGGSWIAGLHTTNTFMPSHNPPGIRFLCGP